MKRITIFFAFLIGSFIQLSAQCANFSRPGVHVVQSGENLYRISKLYNISVPELAQWNSISTTTTLYACQELSIPNATNSRNTIPSTREEFVERSPADYQSSAYNYTDYGKQAGNKHIIKAGETIAQIAELYGYTEDRFRKINLLKPGEELTVGSAVLSTDCACNRVVTYDELGNYNAGYGAGSTNYNYSGTNSSNPSPRNERIITEQPRGGGSQYAVSYTHLTLPTTPYV